MKAEGCLSTLVKEMASKGVAWTRGKSGLETLISAQVEARYKGRAKWYPGVVAAARADELWKHLPPPTLCGNQPLSREIYDAPKY